MMKGMDLHDGYFDSFKMADCHLDELLEMESVSIECWNIAINEPQFKLWWRSMPGSSVHQFKMEYTMMAEQDISPESAWNALWDMIYRREWDTQCLDTQVVESFGSNSDCVYLRMRFPPGISNRDCCHFRARRAVSSEGPWLISYRSGEHPECPKVKSDVRINSTADGIIIRLLERDESAGSDPTENEGNETGLKERTLRLTLLAQDNLGGWVPTMLVNFLTTKLAPRLVQDALSACRNYPDYLKKEKETDTKF